MTKILNHVILKKYQNHIVIFHWQVNAADTFSCYSEVSVNKVHFVNTTGAPQVKFIFKATQSVIANIAHSSRYIHKKPDLLIRDEYLFLVEIKIPEKQINKYLIFK